MSSFLKSLEGIKSPYYGRFKLDTKRYDVIMPEENSEHPAIEVVESHVQKIKALYVQVIKVCDSETGEMAYVRRIVADVGEDREMDITDPVSIDAELTETGIDTKTCAAGCGLVLDAYDLVIINGKAYHKFCVDGYVESGKREDDDGERGTNGDLGGN